MFGPPSEDPLVAHHVHDLFDPSSDQRLRLRRVFRFDESLPVLAGYDVFVETLHAYRKWFEVGYVVRPGLPPPEEPTKKPILPWDDAVYDDVGLRYRPSGGGTSFGCEVSRCRRSYSVPFAPHAKEAIVVAYETDGRGRNQKIHEVRSREVSLA